jgi:hypothetical protein
MPAEQRIGRGDRGELVQLVTTDANSPYRQAAPVGVSQAEARSAEVPAEYPILGNQVGEGITLAMLQPTGEHDEEQLEGRTVDHERQLTSPSGSEEGVDRIVGHYALAVALQSLGAGIWYDEFALRRDLPR